MGIWDVVKLMKGLLHIQAWVKVDQESGNTMTTDQEARLFAPLMNLDWVREFKVEATWPANEGSEALLLDAPFYFARNDDLIPEKPEFGEEQVTCSLGSS